MIELENFARNIAKLRKEQGISKREMAGALGIGRWSMDKLDAGMIPPRLGAEVLFYAAHYFGISISDLLQNPQR